MLFTLSLDVHLRFVLLLSAITIIIITDVIHSSSPALRIALHVLYYAHAEHCKPSPVKCAICALNIINIYMTLHMYFLQIRINQMFRDLQFWFDKKKKIIGIRKTLNFLFYGS